MKTTRGANRHRQTLLGSTKNSFERYRAEPAARYCKRVAAVANEIVVRPPGGPPSDAEIARAAVEALKLEFAANRQGLWIGYSARALSRWRRSMMGGMLAAAALEPKLVARIG